MPHPLETALDEHALRVSEYLELINSLVSPLRAHVTGEVTDFKVTRDWVFLSLKDTEDGSLLRSGMHVSKYRAAGVPLEDGMEIKISGHSKVSPRSGNFGFWIEHIELVGEGAIKRAYELLRAQLEKEGIFSRKRPIPSCIRHIGVISSRDGVVIHDLRKNLASRGIRIDFLHSAVDGEKASGELVQAVEYFSRCHERPDVIVIIRGGGSLESLQCFNNETLCRALFASPVPVIAGIGHEVDVPLAALAADVCSSTPTAVASVINRSWDALTETLPLLERTITERFASSLADRMSRVRFLAKSMHAAFDGLFSRYKTHQASLVHAYAQIQYRIDQSKREQGLISQKIIMGFGAMLARMRDRTERHEALLAAVDPVKTLNRGYSLAYDKDGRLLRSVSLLSSGDEVSVVLGDGSFDAQVERIEKKQ